MQPWLAAYLKRWCGGGIEIAIDFHIESFYGKPAGTRAVTCGGQAKKPLFCAYPKCLGHLVPAPADPGHISGFTLRSGFPLQRQLPRISLDTAQITSFGTIIVAHASNQVMIWL